MINKPRVASTPLIVLIIPFVTASLLFADGYRNPPEGARAIGAFGGHRAFADDANANIHNSANLVDLEQPMIQLNTTFGYGRNKFKTSGVSDQTEDPFFAIPGFSAAVPFKEGKYAVGLSAYVPYGRSVDWGDDSFFAQSGLPYAGSMMVADFTPNFAMRVTDTLSIGIGADIYYGEVEQKQFIIPGLLHSKLTANGDALGWNAAVTWKMTEKQRLTATYRSPFKIKYEGDNELSGIVNSKSDADATIEYPTVVGLAYGIELTDTLRAEINGEWLEFSQHETLTINNPGGIGTVAVPQNLKDTWTAGAGLAWNFKPRWTLRSGYMYLRNPTPDDTYGPLSPDEDQGVVSLGLGYETEHHAIDLACAYGLFDGRNISGSSASPDGKYDYDVSLLSLSYGYKF
jgi:long-chain fatty acid transport protein